MLWKKESDRVDALYADLLDRPSIDVIYRDYQRSFKITKHMEGYLFMKSAAKASEFRLKGNKWFEEKNWVHAMEMYNQSMCFAEDGSELMGLAYANRSSCFFNMKMYTKCLLDIELAKLNNYPQDKMAKLDERKRMCLDKMEKETDQSDMFEPKLDYEPNEMFPCFADVIEIEKNNKCGRHIVAKEDIDVGKTVMVDESYLAETIYQKYRRCSVCLRSAENLKPCNKCTFTMFCSRCENNNFHDIECQINPIYFGSLQFESYRMVVVRSILLAMKAFADVDQLMAFVEQMLLNDAVEAPESLSDSQSKYRAFFKLQPNTKEEADEKLPQKIYLIYQLLINQSEVSTFFHTEGHKRFLIQLIGHHISVIKNWCRNDRYNVGEKGIHNEDFEIYFEHRISIPSSYFNHSCAPNCVIVSRNGINTCIIVRPVRKGEELCIPYDEKVLPMPKPQRQEKIRSKFNFRCKCDRCRQPHLESISVKPNYRIQIDPDFLSFQEDMDNIDGGTYHETVLLYAKAFRLLKKFKKEGWCQEISANIYYLYSLALIETNSVAGLAFMGSVNNEQFS